MNSLKSSPKIIDPTYINVKTSEGMFSTEKAVLIELFNGQKISLFADEHLLKEENGSWFLKVTPVKRNGKSQVVLLPSEALENATRWVEVAL